MGKFEDADLATAPLNLLSAPVARKYFFYGRGKKLLRELWGPRATRDDLEPVLIPCNGCPVRQPFSCLLNVASLHPVSFMPLGVSFSMRASVECHDPV